LDWGTARLDYLGTGMYTLRNGSMGGNNLEFYLRCFLHAAESYGAEIEFASTETAVPVIKIDR